MLIEYKETPSGLYLTTTSKGIKYGQGYKTNNKDEARYRFIGLVKTYEVKGAAYVARNGSVFNV